MPQSPRLLSRGVLCTSWHSLEGRTSTLHEVKFFCEAMNAGKQACSKRYMHKAVHNDDVKMPCIEG